MPWEIIECSDGAFEVNRLGVELIMRSFVRADSMRKNARTQVEHHVFGPDLHSVEIDFGAVRTDVDSSSPVFVKDFFDKLAGGWPMREGINSLVELRDVTRRHQASLEEKQRAAQHQTMLNIDQSVERGETAKAVAEGVRDLCGEALLVGATMLSGGAAALVITGGATLKGVGKFQDTNHVGEAVVETASNLLFGFVGLGVDALELKGAAKVVMTFTISQNQGLLDVARSSWEGKTVLQSFGTGGKTFGLDPSVEMAVKALLPKGSLWAVPIISAVKWGAGKAIDAATAPKAAPPAAENRPKIPPLADTGVADQAFIDQTVARRFHPSSRP
jgi:hypothetical protein